MTRTIRRGDRVIFHRPHRELIWDELPPPCWGEVRQVYSDLGSGAARVKWADGTHSIISCADRRIVEIR